MSWMLIMVVFLGEGDALRAQQLTIPGFQSQRLCTMAAMEVGEMYRGTSVKDVRARCVRMTEPRT